MSTIYEEWLDANGLSHEPHQKEAVKWCLAREKAPEHKGGIIADEMGLGKTIEILGTVYCNSLANTLIVLPYSLLAQWEKIIEKLMGIKPLVYHGNKQKRIQLTVEDIKRYPIVLTTYGLISLKRPPTHSEVTINPLYSIQWDRIIYDEAHHLRNGGTKVNLGAHQLHAHITWLMTGTPIQNEENDLYSLYQLLGCTNIKKNIEMLVRDYMLRRTKEKAGIILPACHSSIIDVAWKYKKESKLAEHIHAKLKFSNLVEIDADKKIKSVENGENNGENNGEKREEKEKNILANVEEGVFKRLNKAKKVCVLPKLMKKTMRRLILDGVVEETPAKMVEMLKEASKIESVVQMIVERRDNGKPKMVFCYFHGEIDELVRLLQLQRIDVRKIDGRTGKKERANILNGAPCEVLIGQIDATNEGLNLQAYKEIYMVSPHWNPAIEDQAIARCHRIGQKDEVEVFRFIMNGFVGYEQPLTVEKNIEDELLTTPVLKALTLDQHICNVQERKRKIIKRLLLIDTF